jgi:NAD(P)-dependent dehydrogenase (short-subunit alcohol dehydrogenase family)
MGTRTALITGASRGLGYELARALSASGWSLVVDGRDAAALEAAVGSWAGGDIAPLPGDVADPAHQQSLFAEVAKRGRLDLLVNNASSLGPTPLPSLADYPLGQLQVVLEVNVIAPLGLIQLALPWLRKSGGRIINITSDAAVEGYPGWGGYGSSKAALEQASRVLAAEEADVRVYWVDPGDMNTRMQQDAYPGEDVSDRPPASDSVPGLLSLIEGALPSGRYSARALP